MPTSVPTVGCLYVAATPLGNLQDISRRLSATLAAASLVLAEDTRRSAIVLAHLQLRRPLRSLHSHNEVSRTAGVLDALARGEAVVLVSDAGTPAVSDPGAHLVAAVHAAGHPVCPIPGPSALTASLSAAGFPPGASGVLFVGFLPRSGAARTEALARVAGHTGAVVVFEAPDRLGRTLAQLAGEAPERAVCLCRELTKLHEEVRVAPLAAMAARYADVPPVERLPSCWHPCRRLRWTPRRPPPCACPAASTQPYGQCWPPGSAPGTPQRPWLPPWACPVGRSMPLLSPWAAPARRRRRAHSFGRASPAAHNCPYIGAPTVGRGPT